MQSGRSNSLKNGTVFQQPGLSASFREKLKWVSLASEKLRVKTSRLDDLTTCHFVAVWRPKMPPMIAKPWCALLLLPDEHPLAIHFDVLENLAGAEAKELHWAHPGPEANPRESRAGPSSGCPESEIRELFSISIGLVCIAHEIYKWRKITRSIHTVDPWIPKPSQSWISTKWKAPREPQAPFLLSGALTGTLLKTRGCCLETELATGEFAGHGKSVE